MNASLSGRDAAIAEAQASISELALDADADDRTVTDPEDVGWNNAIGEALDVLSEIAARVRAD